MRKKQLFEERGQQMNILPSLLKNYKTQDKFNKNEMGSFLKCLPDNKLTSKKQNYHITENRKLH